jgi:hypothetical protein
MCLLAFKILKYTFWLKQTTNETKTHVTF